MLAALVNILLNLQQPVFGNERHFVAAEHLHGEKKAMRLSDYAIFRIILNTGSSSERFLWGPKFQEVCWDGEGGVRRDSTDVTLSPTE